MTLFSADRGITQRNLSGYAGRNRGIIFAVSAACGTGSVKVGTVAGNLIRSPVVQGTVRPAG